MDEQSLDWESDALNRIARMRKGTVFTSAGIIARQRKDEVELPAELRVYGALMRRLARDRVIAKVCLIQTPDRSHGGITTLWRKR